MEQEKKERIVTVICANQTHCSNCKALKTCLRVGGIDKLKEKDMDEILAIYDLKTDELTPDEYVKKAMRTNDGLCSTRLFEKVFWADAYGENMGELLNGALGITGEAGEVADIIKKYFFHGHQLDKDALIKEMGDVMWYIALLCHALKVPFATVMERNIGKLEKRYKDGFSEKASQNREE